MMLGYTQPDCIKLNKVDMSKQLMKYKLPGLITGLALVWCCFLLMALPG